MFHTPFGVVVPLILGVVRLEPDREVRSLNRRFPRYGETALSDRQRMKHTESLNDRVAAFANNAQEKANLLPPGPERDAMLKKVRQAKTAAHLDQWAQSPGLQPPK
jgi:hypothetical protein